jgi:hypothetical protein
MPAIRRALCPTVTVTPKSCSSFSICRPSSSVLAIGFSV